MFLQRFEMSDAVLLGPHESVQDVAFHKCGIAGKPNDIAALIDRRRRVPPLRAKVANVSHATVFPKHRVPGRMSSNRLIADAGNAHDLTVIIDRRSGSRSVAGKERQVLDLVWRTQCPHGWEKPENLGRDACLVVNTV